MKLAERYGQQAETAGIQATRFGFEMDAKMYDILISKMYSNKPGAVIRELAANAWDAHVEAGKQDTPFHIHLPTWLSKDFFIRDYGTGIPHEKFQDIYTNVGASTKEDTNDLIGGFGLGSKTPFTMTDTFLVENFHAGIKTTWVCFKDAGVPNVTKMNEETSDEPTGLKVSFTFEEGDVQEYTKQITRQLKYFPVKPKVTGGEGNIQFTALPDGWEKQDYFYESTDSWNKKHYVVMGNVCYALDEHQVDDKHRGLFYKSLTLKVPIGELDIPPSREHLEFTERTKRNLHTRLETIRAKYQQEFEAEVKNAKNAYELHKIVYNSNRNILNTEHNYTVNGKIYDIHALRRSYTSKIGTYTTRSLQGLAKQRLVSSSLGINDVPNKKFYVNDLGKGYNKHLNTININKQATDKGVTLSSIVILNPNDITIKGIDASVKLCQDEVEKEIGIKPELLSGVFGKPAKGTPVKGRAGPNQVFAVVTNGSSVKTSLTEYTGDYPKDGYYIELHQWSILGLRGFTTQLDRGLLKVLDKPLYAVRSKSIPKLPKTLKLLDNDTLGTFKGKLEELIDTEATQDYLYLNIPVIPNTLAKEVSAFTDSKLKVLVRYYRRYGRKRGASTRYTDLYNLLYGKRYEAKIDVSEDLGALIKHYTDNYAKIIRSILSHWSDERNKETMQELLTVINLNK